MAIPFHAIPLTPNRSIYLARVGERPAVGAGRAVLVLLGVVAGGLAAAAAVAVAVAVVAAAVAVAVTTRVRVVVG